MNIQNLIFNLLGNAYWLDTNNVYQGCCIHLAKLMGFQSNLDIIGKTNKELPIFLNKPKLAEEIDNNNLQVLTSGNSKIFYETMIFNKKETIYLTQKFPLIENNKIIGLFGVSSEVTEQKLAELQEQKKNEEIKVTLEHIIANMPGHVYWKDKKGIYQGCNDLQAKSLGLNFGHEVVGKTDFDLPWKKEVAQNYRNNDLHIMKTRETQIIEEESQQENSTITVLSQKTALQNKNNEVVGVLGISLDITDRKKIENDLNEAKEAAVTANKAKTDFLYNMQHDFRSPFVGIVGIAELMHNQEDNVEKKENLEHIMNSGNKILKQLDEIFELIYIEKGMLKVLNQTFDLHEVINDTKTIALPLAIQKNLKLKFNWQENVPKYLIGDRIRTQRILMNLLTNAIKFTTKGHVKLHISLEKIEKSNIAIQFKVEDSGIGMEKSDINIIYEKFTRLIPTNKGIFSGQGLGLHIVKEFIKDLNGEIYVDTKINKGTTFTILIPYKMPLLQRNLSQIKDTICL